MSNYQLRLSKLDQSDFLYEAESIDAWTDTCLIDDVSDGHAISLNDIINYLGEIRLNYAVATTSLKALATAASLSNHFISASDFMANVELATGHPLSEVGEGVNGIMETVTNPETDLGSKVNAISAWLTKGVPSSAKQEGSDQFTLEYTDTSDLNGFKGMGQLIDEADGVGTLIVESVKNVWSAAKVFVNDCVKPAVNKLKEKVVDAMTIRAFAKDESATNEYLHTPVVRQEMTHPVLYGNLDTSPVPWLGEEGAVQKRRSSVPVPAAFNPSDAGFDSPAALYAAALRSVPYTHMISFPYKFGEVLMWREKGSEEFESGSFDCPHCSLNHLAAAGRSFYQWYHDDEEYTVGQDMKIITQPVLDYSRKGGHFDFYPAITPGLDDVWYRDHNSYIRWTFHEDVSGDDYSLSKIVKRFPGYLNSKSFVRGTGVTVVFSVRFSTDFPSSELDLSTYPHNNSSNHILQVDNKDKSLSDGKLHTIRLTAVQGKPTHATIDGMVSSRLIVRNGSPVNLLNDLTDHTSDTFGLFTIHEYYQAQSEAANVPLSAHLEICNISMTFGNGDGDARVTVDSSATVVEEGYGWGVFRQSDGSPAPNSALPKLHYAIRLSSTTTGLGLMKCYYSERNADWGYSSYGATNANDLSKIPFKCFTIKPINTTFSGISEIAYSHCDWKPLRMDIDLDPSGRTFASGFSGAYLRQVFDQYGTFRPGMLLGSAAEPQVSPGITDILSVFKGALSSEITGFTGTTNDVTVAQGLMNSLTLMHLFMATLELKSRCIANDAAPTTTEVYYNGWANLTQPERMLHQSHFLSLASGLYYPLSLPLDMNAMHDALGGGDDEYVLNTDIVNYLRYLRDDGSYNRTAFPYDALYDNFIRHLMIEYYFNTSDGITRSKSSEVRDNYCFLPYRELNAMEPGGWTICPDSVNKRKGIIQAVVALGVTALVAVGAWKIAKIFLKKKFTLMHMQNESMIAALTLKTNNSSKEMLEAMAEQGTTTKDWNYKLYIQEQMKDFKQIIKIKRLDGWLGKAGQLLGLTPAISAAVAANDAKESTAGLLEKLSESSKLSTMGSLSGTASLGLQVKDEFSNVADQSNSIKVVVDKVDRAVDDLPAIKESVSSLPDNINSVKESISEAVSEQSEAITSEFSLKLTDFSNTINDATDTAIKELNDSISENLKGITEAQNEAFSGLNDALSAVENNIGDAISSSATDIKSANSECVGETERNIKTSIEGLAISEGVQTDISTLSSGISEIREALTNSNQEGSVPSLISSLSAKIDSNSEATSKGFSNADATADSNTSTIIGKLKEFITNLIGADDSGKTLLSHVADSTAYSKNAANRSSTIIKELRAVQGLETYENSDLQKDLIAINGLLSTLSTTLFVSTDSQVSFVDTLRSWIESLASHIDAKSDTIMEHDSTTDAEIITAVNSNSDASSSGTIEALTNIISLIGKIGTNTLPGDVV